ncbi:MAG TPA: PAS domain S-box protein, partial [Stenomitos sp.]
PWLELVHPDDVELTLNTEPLSSQHSFVEYENRYRHKEGSYRWLSWRVSSAENGLTYRVAKDITATKSTKNIAVFSPEERNNFAPQPVPIDLQQAVAELTEWKNRYEAAGQINGLLLYEWNSQTEEIIWGSNVEQVFGYAEEELSGSLELWMELIHPDDIEKVIQELNRANTTKERLHVEYRMRQKDGSYIILEDNGRFYPDSAGNLNRMVGFIANITERKRAQLELQKAYQQLELLVDNSPLAIMEWDKEFRLQRWSKQAEKIFGWKACEVLNRHPKEWHFVYDEDAPMVDHILSQLMDGTLQRTVDENRNYTKNRKIVYCEWYNSALFDESGHLVSILSLVLDISDRKQTEAALQEVMTDLEIRVEERTAELQQINQRLSAEITERLRTEAAVRQSEEQFRRVFDEAPIGMSLAGLDNRYLRINRAFFEMLGYTESELMALTFMDITHGEDLELEIPFMRQIIQGEIDHFTLEKRYLKKNQEIVWVNLTLIALRDQSGLILYTLAMIEDITVRKQAQEAVQQSEARYRAMIEDQTELICRYKPDGTLTFVNDTYCRYFQKQHSELIDHKFIPVIPEEDKLLVSQNCGSLGVEQSIVTHEHRIILPSGEIRWLQWTNRALFDDSGHILEFQAVGRDITKLKQAEAKIVKALERERELSELRSGFVSLVSHEFRTPLTTIQSSAELLERYNHKLSQEKKHNHYRRIQNAVQRMTQLLEDVLMIGKAEAGKLKFMPSSMDLIAFCRDLVESLQMSAKPQHQLNFVVIGEGHDAQMDDKLLGHILTNLLTNAIKYSPDGGNVQFDLICDHTWANFCIQDSGIGIPPEDLERLFESFGRASNVGAIPGTGLGLAIVKRCVDLHQGQITVESKVGMGTTFKVTLPLKSQPSINVIDSCEDKAC